MASEATPVKYRTPLRQAQRELTRSRIKDAARTLFYEHHYDTTTMDQIAVAAGLRRSTLYLHYKDKSEILAEVIDDYTPEARAALSRMPGPNPTEQQLYRWISDVAKWVDRERVRISIIMELRRSQSHNMRALVSLTNELIGAMGENNPPFREAARDEADPVSRARALLLLQQLTYACELYLDEAGSPFGRALLQRTAKDFLLFLTEEAAPR